MRGAIRVFGAVRGGGEVKGVRDLGGLRGGRDTRVVVWRRSWVTERMKLWPSSLKARTNLLTYI